MFQPKAFGYKVYDRYFDFACKKRNIMYGDIISHVMEDGTEDCEIISMTTIDNKIQKELGLKEVYFTCPEDDEETGYCILSIQVVEEGENEKEMKKKALEKISKANKKAFEELKKDLNIKGELGLYKIYDPYRK